VRSTEHLKFQLFLSHKRSTNIENINNQLINKMEKNQSQKKKKKSDQSLCQRRRRYSESCMNGWDKNPHVRFRLTRFYVNSSSSHLLLHISYINKRSGLRVFVYVRVRERERERERESRRDWGLGFALCYL
jgi:hypothetical protein